MHMHMAPLALTFALLGFWLALGWAVQAIVKPRLEPLTSLLLAPLIGLSATLVPVFWLSLIGMHAAHFARPLTLVLAALAAVGWIIRRPQWRWAHAVPVGIAALAVLAIGIPTLAFGFDWVGNANDDWANYNLGALRLVDHGLLHQPDLGAMAAGQDYPGYYYFTLVGADARPGSELMLAWLGAMTRQSPFLVFMPLILAFDGVMICAAAALAVRGARSRLHWFLGLLLAAAAPLSLYAVHQQLIAQVLGVAFTCGLLTLTCISLGELAGWRRLVLVSLVASAFLMAYPEIVPFYGLAFLIYHAAHIRDRGWNWSRGWRMLLIPIGLAVFTGPYLVSSIFYLAHQFDVSSTQGRYGGVSIFPYFVVPSGAPMLWGFLPLGQFAPEPWLSIAIAVALALSAFTLVAALIRLRAGSLMAGMLLIFGLVAVQLAVKQNDFGLFKIAMFVQPFLWFTLSSAIPGERVVPIAFTMGLGAVLLYTDVGMVEASLRDRSGGTIEVAGASRGHLLHSVLSGADPTLCDTEFETANLPLVKILSARPGCTVVFPSRLVFSAMGMSALTGVNPLHRIAGIDDFLKRAQATLAVDESVLTFKRPDGSAVDLKYFDIDPGHTKFTAFHPSEESLVNASQGEGIRAHDHSGFHDRLEFVESSLGSHYYIPRFPQIGIYAAEPDTFDTSRRFEAVGRYLLFRVLNPSPTLRVALDITMTVLPGGSRQLPPAVIMGETSASFGLVGNGSARVLSPPIKPLTSGRSAYVLLDLGEDAKPLVRPRSGMMSLYGSKLAIDYRVATAFARNISAIDADHVVAEVPSSVVDIGAALADPGLTYSGIYEDGWIGQDGFVRLGIDAPGKLEFHAMLPDGIGITTDAITLSVDGRDSVTRPITPGDLAVDMPIPPGPHRISWHFAAASVLPDGDDRAAAALLKSITIEKDMSTAPSSITDVKAALSDPAVRHDGLYADGWMAQDGFVDLKADGPGKVEFRAMMPEGVGLAHDDVTVSVEGGDSVTRSVVPGNIAVDVPVTAGPHRISWRFAKVGILPNGDGRVAAALLKSVAIASDTGKAASATGDR